MTLFTPEPVPRYEEGVVRYLDASFEKVRQAFSLLQRSTNGTTNPASGSVGQQFFNTTTGTLYVYDGSRWVPSGGNLPRSHQLLAGGQTLASGANSNINWGTAQIAFGATAATNTLTPTVRGWWKLEASVTVAANATGMRALYITRDGTVVSIVVHNTVNATFNWPLSTGLQFYSAGTGSVDVFRVYVYHNAGVGLGMVSAESRLTMHYMGGGNP